MSRYVVTGCAGFVGSHVAEALLSRGDEVVGVDSFTDYYPRAVKKRNLARAEAETAFQLVEEDLYDADLDAMLRSVSGVFHIAAQPGVRASWDGFAAYVRNNVLVSQRVFEAAARRGVRIVFASSSTVYGDSDELPTSESAERRPRSPYGVTKAACEDLAAAYGASNGADIVILRYFSVYGPRQRPDMAIARIIGALLDGRPFVLYGDGTQSRDLTFVADAVSATTAAMDSGRAGTVYNVGGGTEASLREIVAALEELAGRTLDIQAYEAAPGDVRRTAADTTRIRDELGWRPRTPLAEGLAAQFRWTVDEHGEAVDESARAGAPA